MRDDPVAAVDALVAGVDPGLSSPGVESRDVVLVTGPWLAGATSLIAALRDRTARARRSSRPTICEPARRRRRWCSWCPPSPRSTESDCALLDLAANHTDLVIGVVSKIDVHRNWRDVLAADRAAARRARRALPACAVGRRGGRARYGRAAARRARRRCCAQRLADADVKRRNRLRAWESRCKRDIALSTRTARARTGRRG